MKNSTRLFFFSTLLLSLSLTSCYYPYEEEAALPARPVAPTVYSGFFYGGFGWPLSPWPYYYGPYYGPSFYSVWGPWRPVWYYPPPPPRRWQPAPPYRPANPSYRPGGPRPSNPPAYRPDGPRFRPESDGRRSYSPDADQFYHGRR